MRQAGHVACTAHTENKYKILVGKPERTGPLGRPRHILKDIINMVLEEIILKRALKK
jgi:hypothetical protein